MKLSAVAFALLTIILVSYYFLTGYRSAFEADQACHSERWNGYEESMNLKCDHDLETNQWILYEEGLNHQPAKVVKRYRY